MATDEIALILLCDAEAAGAQGDAPYRREVGSYAPRTRLSKALTKQTVGDFPGVGTTERPIWLLQAVDSEDAVAGLILGASSSAHGVLLGPRRGDRIGALSLDGRHLFVRFTYTEEARPLNHVFRQLFGRGKQER